MSVWVKKGRVLWTAATEIDMHKGKTIEYKMGRGGRARAKARVRGQGIEEKGLDREGWGRARWD